MTAAEIKNIYLTEDTPVMSELVREYTNDLSLEEIKDLLAWAGDDEWMTVTDSKEIVCKNITIEQAEEDIKRKYMFHPDIPVTFASGYVDSEDLLGLFHNCVENPTGLQLLKAFAKFYEDDNLREEIETAMLDAAEAIITRELSKIDMEG